MNLKLYADIETAVPIAGLLFGKINDSLSATDMTQIAGVDNQYKLTKFKDLDHRWNLINETYFMPSDSESEGDNC